MSGFGTTVLGTPFAKVKFFGSRQPGEPCQSKVAVFKSETPLVRAFGNVVNPVFGIRLPAEISRGETWQESTPCGREVFREPKGGIAQNLCNSMLKVRLSGRRALLFA